MRKILRPHPLSFPKGGSKALRFGVFHYNDRNYLCQLFMNADVKRRVSRHFSESNFPNAIFPNAFFSNDKIPNVVHNISHSKFCQMRLFMFRNVCQWQGGEAVVNFSQAWVGLNEGYLGGSGEGVGSGWTFN